MKWECLSFSLSFSLSPSISLLRRPPNQARGFPRPLYNRCTIHPIVHLLSCVSALESLLVCQPCRGSQERPAPLLPPLYFSLFPLLTRSCSKLLVFLMCSPVATLKSSGHSFDLDRGPLKKVGLQTIMCCRTSGLLLDKGMICFHMCGPRGEGGNFSFRFQLLDLKQVFGSAGVELVLSDTKLMWREGALPQTTNHNFPEPKVMS